MRGREEEEGGEAWLTSAKSVCLATSSTPRVKVPLISPAECIQDQTEFKEEEIYIINTNYKTKQIKTDRGYAT